MKHAITSMAGALAAGIIAAAVPAQAQDHAQNDVAGFASGTAIVPTKAKPTLDDLANAANRNPDSKIVIVGHTDNTGNAAHNQALALDRAQLVRSELVQRGIDVNRISVQAGGADNPIAGNDTRAGRRENRRAEVIIGGTESTMVGSSQGGATSSGSAEDERNGEHKEHHWQHRQHGQQQQSGQHEENEKYRE